MAELVLLHCKCCFVTQTDRVRAQKTGELVFCALLLMIYSFFSSSSYYFLEDWPITFRSASTSIFCVFCRNLEFLYNLHPSFCLAVSTNISVDNSLFLLTYLLSFDAASVGCSQPYHPVMIH